MGKGKAALDRTLRDAMTTILEPEERVEVTVHSYIGIGQWPLLLVAAAVAFVLNISVPDSFGRSLLVAVIFGLSIFAWFFISPAHGVVLTDHRVLIFPLTQRNQIKGAPWEEPRSGLEAGGTLSGWGLLKLVIHRSQQPPLRLNVPSPWRREAEALRAALQGHTDFPG
jgi:uncharacterized membrane protein YccC